MAETKLITSLYVVTDTETSYNKIGDINGGLFNEKLLESHIRQHGSEQLIEKLASMQMQVLDMKYKIKHNSGECSESLQNLFKC